MNSYEYADIGGRYFYLQSNPAALAWRLYSRGKPFGFRNKGVLASYYDARRVLSLLKALRRERRGQGNKPVIELEVRGDLCLPVHNGYKVFDLRRKTTVKLFSPEIDLDTVRSEVERVQDVGRHSFAPSVRRYSIEDRWYEEDFINGYPARFSSWDAFPEAFRSHLAPMVRDMILATAPKPVNALEYVRAKQAVLEVEGGKLGDRRLDAARVEAIRNFTGAVTEQLRADGERRVCLVFSHGDFSPKHVLVTASGGVAVDWETFGYRSALFDLYNAFFQQLWLRHEAPDIVAQMGKAIAVLQSQLARSSELSQTLSLAKFYRRIYYIERVCRIVEVQEMNDPMLDNILRWIDAFNRYEDMAAEAPIDNSHQETAE